MSTLQTTGYAPVNGINMYYEVHGSGEVPLVLVHGGGSTIETSFGSILPFFAAKNKVIAVELQAHGRTTDRSTSETFEQDADDVAALLQYLKIDKANFLGFSNGGTTTLQLAIRHPQLINKIVVVSGVYKRDGLINGFFDNMQHATINNIPAELKAAFLNVTPDEERLLNMFNKDKQRMIDFKDISDDDISAIKAPALFMVADQDVVTVEHTIKMKNLVANSQLAVLPGMHGSFLGEIMTAKNGDKVPEATAIIVHNFLNR